mgnify:FL=1
MKKNLLKGVMAMAFAMFAMGTFAQGETKVLTASGDTWVRSNSPSDTWGTQETLEMKTDATNSQSFYGLLLFDVPATDDGYQVKSATLRLVTYYKKGDSKMRLYPLTSAVTNKTTYNDVADQITSALEGEPIAEFAMKGDGTKAPVDKISEAFYTVDAWTNNIDVTASVKPLAGATFSVFIAKVMDQPGTSNKIYSSRAKDMTNTNITFKGEDLVPQLTIVYEKSGTTGISLVNAEKIDDDTYYNLQGVKMNPNNLPHGIYIHQGKKVVK